MTQTKKRNQSVNFPTLFTMDELSSQYSDIVKITLRYKISTAIDRGTVIQLGKIHRPVGRPHIIYAKCPITKNVLQSAIDRGAEIYEDVQNKYKDVPEEVNVKIEQNI